MPAAPTPEIRDLIALTLVPGLGPRLTAALLERFGSASAARNATADELRNVPHVGAKLSRDFARPRLPVALDPEIGRLERFGVHVRPLGSPEYPPALATISDPPLLL